MAHDDASDALLAGLGLDQPTGSPRSSSRALPANRRTPIPFVATSPQRSLRSQHSISDPSATTRAAPFEFDDASEDKDLLEAWDEYQELQEELGVDDEAVPNLLGGMARIDSVAALKDMDTDGANSAAGLSAANSRRGSTAAAAAASAESSSPSDHKSDAGGSVAHLEQKFGHMRSRMLSISGAQPDERPTTAFFHELRQFLSANKWALLFILAGLGALLLCYARIPEPAPATHEEPVFEDKMAEWALPNALCMLEGQPSFFKPSISLRSLVCVKPTGQSWQGYVTMGLVFVSVVLMFMNQPPDLVLLGAVTVLLVTGIIQPATAWEGFGNSGVLSIAVLHVIARALDECGTLEMLLKHVLGRSRSLTVSQVRLLLPVATLSAFINNVPVVAILTPLILSWSRRIGISKSKFLLPLSAASMLGGACTLIGTISNLIVQGLLVRYDNAHKFTGVFDIAPVAVPVALLGIAYCVIFSRFLLPDDPAFVPLEEAAITTSWNPTLKGGFVSARLSRHLGLQPKPDDGGERRYMVAFELKDSALVGQTLDASGLFGIEGASLLKVLRLKKTIWEDGVTNWNARLTTKLEAGDLLVFSSLPESIVHIRKIHGLVPASQDELSKLGRHRRFRRLVEVVLSRDCPLVGRPLSNSGIRQLFSAAIVAVRTHHHGVGLSVGGLVDDADSVTNRSSNPGSRRNSTAVPARMALSPSPGSRKLSTAVSGGKPQGDWMSAITHPDYRLRIGDCLLLETFPDFFQLHKNSTMFALVREVEGSKPPRQDTFMDQFRMVFSFLCLLGFIIATGLGLDLLTAGVVCCAALIATRCLTVDEAFRAIKGRQLLSIVAAIGLGVAMNSTGVAELIAEQIVKVVKPGGSLAILAAFFVMTSLLSSVISNNVTVAIFFPIIYHTFLAMPSLQIKQLLVILMLGGATPFISPISYQTQLMVFGPGSYEFIDYVRFGAGLQLLCGVASVFLVHWLI